MRPVEKGSAPRPYVEFSDAQPDLIAAIGRYCCYCGRFIPEGIAVEHKRPKKRYPGEALLWSNFLLACSNCNSTKGSRKVRLDSFLWPDTDNTLRAICYGIGGVVRPARLLTKRIRRKAARTIQLHGLDVHPGAHRKPSDRDYRWLDRKNQWDKAQLFRLQLQQFDTPAQRTAIIQSALDGVFSIWHEVFKGDIDILRRLRVAFPGTAQCCFNNKEQVVHRIGGQV